MSNDKYYGHMTMTDGSHVLLSENEAKNMMEQIRESEAKSAADMPTSDDALKIFSRALQRLRRLGWYDGSGCPKDGTPFAVIEFGSTGIFRGNYTGEWPYAFANLGDASRHPHGFMWKHLDKLTDDERSKMEACEKDHMDWLDRMFGQEH